MSQMIMDSGRSCFRGLYKGTRVEFPAVVGHGKRFALESRRTGVDCLAISFEGQDFLVGRLAMEEDRFCSQARAKDKTSDDHTLVQVATGAAYSLTDKSEVPLTINYNIRDYAGYRETFAALLQRDYEVTFTRGEYTGVTKRFRFSRVHVVPEGLGAMMHATFNHDGSLKRSDLANSTVVVLDIGSQTCNLAIFRELEFVEELSWAWDLGMHVAESELLDLISRPPFEFEVTTLAELGGILEEKRLQIGKTGHDISQEVFSILDDHARKINEAVSIRLSETDRKRISNVLIAGGGARCLIPFIQPYWPGADVEVLPENRWANCLGQQILAEFANA